MNILLYDMSSYIQADLIYYLKQAGHRCKNVIYHFTDPLQDDFFEWKFSQCLASDNWDCVISTNFFPLVAKTCYSHNLKYLSWSYDSPIDERWYPYFQFPTSYVFLFDYMDALKCNQLGFDRVYHLPLAVNTNRLDKILITDTDKTRFTADISFVGQFYDSPLQNLMIGQSSYDKGYIDAIVQSQLNIYGTNFIDTMISDELLKRIDKVVYNSIHHHLTRWGLTNAITKQIAHIERITLCGALGSEFDLKYYSASSPKELDSLKWNGTAYYFTEMPKIFKLSTLNLCPILRCIQTGIPLRALDIMGCKSTLFCNYQPEIAENFENGVDVIMYESMEDAAEKAYYYLNNKELCTKIASNGYAKVKAFYHYSDRIEKMFKAADL